MGRFRFLQLADSSVGSGRARATASNSVCSVSIHVSPGDSSRRWVVSAAKSASRTPVPLSPALAGSTYYFDWVLNSQIDWQSWC